MIGKHMSARLAGALAAASVASLAIGASGAAAAPAILSVDQNPTVVAAHGDTVMWSERNPMTGGYRLVKSVAGGPKAIVLGIPERDEGPFDLDLGTNSAGSPYAVYTREGIIYRLPVNGGRERRLEFISLGGTNHSPTIDRGRIAFIHGERGYSSLRFTKSIARKPRALAKGVLNDVELGAKHLAYTGYREAGGTGTFRVHIRNIATGRDRVVYKATSGSLNFAGISRPTAIGGGRGFAWARVNLGSGSGNRVVRYVLRTGRLSYAPGSPRFASTAWAGGELGLAFSTALDATRNSACEDGPDRYCSVGLTGPLTFSARP